MAKCNHLTLLPCKGLIRKDDDRSRFEAASLKFLEPIEERCCLDRMQRRCRRVYSEDRSTVSWCKEIKLVTEDLRKTRSVQALVAVWMPSSVSR